MSDLNSMHGRTVVPTISAATANTIPSRIPVAVVKVMLLAIMVFVCPTIELRAQISAQNTQSKVERGIAGTYRFSYLGKPLKAKPQRDSDAPIGMRLSATSNDGTTYEAKFLGTRQGTYDLRALMEHIDGSDVVDISPLKIEIVSTLPKDQRSDLFEAAIYKPKVWGGYRLSICLIGLIWLSIPVIVFIRRSMQPKQSVVIPMVEAVPTFADQLKPLVEAAAAGTLSVREKGSLELLLVHYWRERMAIQEVDMASSIRQLRLHPEAGRLVTTVERWLHQTEPSADTADGSPESIVELLKPYRGEVPRSVVP